MPPSVDSVLPMPRYFLDLDDGERATRDSVGRELVDVAAARMAAVDGLVTLVRDTRPDGERRTFVVVVRDDVGVVVHTARFDYRAETFGVERDVLDSLLDAMMQAYALSRRDGDAIIRAMIERVLFRIGTRIANEVGFRALNKPLNRS